MKPPMGCVCVVAFHHWTICLHENFSITFPQERPRGCVWWLWLWTWNSIKLSQNTEAQILNNFAKVFIYILSSSLWDLVEENDWRGNHHGDLCDQWLGFWVFVWGSYPDVYLWQVWMSHSFSLCLVCLWVLSCWASKHLLTVTVRAVWLLVNILSVFLLLHSGHSVTLHVQTAASAFHNKKGNVHSLSSTPVSCLLYLLVSKISHFNLYGCCSEIANVSLSRLGFLWFFCITQITKETQKLIDANKCWPQGKCIC